MERVEWRPLSVATLATATLLVTWLTAYACVPLIPLKLRPEVDTETLPRLETWLFGRFYGSAMEKTPVRDLMAGIPYAGHFIVPFLFLGVTTLAQRSLHDAPRARPISFMCAVAMTSALEHMSQVLVPTTPPWYVEMHGHLRADYDAEPNPGGFARLDKAYNMSFFRDLYRKGPIPFGSWPSMHFSWPLLVAMHQWTRIGFVLSCVHIVWIAVAAMYSHHHFLLDIMGGYLFTLLGVYLSRLYIFAVLLGWRLWYRHSMQFRAEAFWSLVGARSMRPWRAADIQNASMTPLARRAWAPDLGDVRQLWFGHAIRTSVQESPIKLEPLEYDVEDAMDADLYKTLSTTFNSSSSSTSSKHKAYKGRTQS
jgi:hypothetical protein